MGIAAGPIIGWLSDQVGATPYGGFQTEAIGKWRATALSAGFVGRYTHDRRLSHGPTVAIDQSVGKLKFGAAYQPIRRQTPSWEQRLAGRVSAATSFGRIGFELRRTVVPVRRWSAHVDVVIPLKK